MRAQHSWSPNFDSLCFLRDLFAWISPPKLLALPFIQIPPPKAVVAMVNKPTVFQPTFFCRHPKWTCMMLPSFRKRCKLSLLLT